MGQRAISPIVVSARGFSEKRYEMSVDCHYDVIGVGSDASAQEIVSAYAAAIARFKRRLTAGKPLPLERLDAIRTAYRVLSCPDQRRLYDAACQEAAVTYDDRAGSGALGAEALAASTSGTEVSAEFRGSGEEYFRIWLVNVALTLLTLGIYSAWATVRREKYFHRNLIVDAAAFDYHGKPRAILFGRLVMLLFFVAASLADKFGVVAKLAVFAFAIAVFPWLLVQSMRFRSRNTSYRGICFSFSGSYRHAFVLLVLHGGLCVLTLGLYFPAFLQKQKAFIAEHLLYGNMRARYSGRVGAFYRSLAVPLAIWLLALLGFVAIFFFAQSKGAAIVFVLLALPMLVLAIVLLQLILVPYVRVTGTNLLWNHMTLGGTSFLSTLKVRAYLGMTLSNWALILLTLGFFWPLAQVRLARFRARHMTVLNPQGLAAVYTADHGSTSAVGSEAVSAIDLDLAL